MDLYYLPLIKLGSFLHDTLGIYNVRITSKPGTIIIKNHAAKLTNLMIHVYVMAMETILVMSFRKSRGHKCESQTAKSLIILL